MAWKSLASIAMWYGTNIGVVCLNKGLISMYNFEFPIFLTFMHMCSAMFWSEFMANRGFLVKQPLQPSQKKSVFFLGSLFCVSVVSGNFSFKYIHVSFTQAIGSTTPVFAAVLGVMFLAKYEHWQTYMTLIPVVLGAMVATIHEPTFHLVGFIFALNATWTRAARAVLQEKLMSGTVERLDPLNLLRYMAPVAAVELGIFAVIMEPESFWFLLNLIAEDTTFLMLLLTNLFLAYFVNLGGMLVTQYNGSLALQVLGNMKGVVAAAVSVMIFGNPVSTVACIGYAFCVAGVWAFSESKKFKRPDPKNDRQDLESQVAKQ